MELRPAGELGACIILAIHHHICVLYCLGICIRSIVDDLLVSSSKICVSLQLDLLRKPSIHS